MAWPVAFALWVAAAEPSAGLLEWSAPRACPSEAEVQHELRSLLPRPSDPPPASFTGRVHAIADRYVLELLSSDPAMPVRQLSASDCRTLASAAMLVVAIELDPLRTTAVLPTAPEPPEPPEPSQSPAVTLPGPMVPLPPNPSPSYARDVDSRVPPGARASSPDPATSPSPTAGRLRGMVGIYAGAGSMALPRAGTLVSAAVGLGGRHVRAEVLGELQPGQQATYPRDTAGATLRMRAGALRGCPTLHPGAVEVPLCLGLWLGALHGQGRGVQRVREATDMWIALELNGGIAWSPTPRVALRVGTGATLALRRPSFLLRERPLLFRAPRFGTRVTVGVELRFSARGDTESTGSGD